MVATARRLHCAMQRKQSVSALTERYKMFHMTTQRREETMRLRNWTKLFALLATIILIVPAFLTAQNTVTGALAGTVTDPTGAVVPGAALTLRNNATGESQSGVSNASGVYTFPLLRPGAYSLNVSKTGFSAENVNVDVQLGQTSSINIKLTVGNTTETVEVTGQTQLLQTEDANITTTYGAAQIAALPNPGNDITSYAQTAPGVQMNTGGSFGNFSAFGLPSTSNLFTENGNDENDPFLNLNNSGASNLTLGQNEIQEVTVVSNGYTGQYGRQAGVQVDYATKSGGNAWHGNANYNWNGSALNANEWFIKQSQIGNGLPNQAPFANNNQWAASLGGAIKKDKLFFFVDQEGLRYVLPSTQAVYFPTPAFSANVLGNIAATQPAQLPFYTNELNLYKNAPSYNSAVPITAANDAALGCGDYSANGFGAGGLPCLQKFQASGLNQNKEWLLTTRVDYNISSADRLFGRFKVDHGQQPTSTDLILPAVFSTQSVQPAYEGQLNETHIFNANTVNNLIISGLWYTAEFQPDSGQAAVLAANGGISTLSFGPNLLSTLGGTNPNSPDYIFPQGRNVTQYQGIDDLSLTRGAHTFKMGVNFRRNDLSVIDAQVLTGGLLNFNSITDFVNGQAIGQNGDAFVQRFTQNGDVPLAIYSLGLYFQDEVRVTPNLKLTLALRGDRNSNAVCQTNCFSRLDNQFTQLTHEVNTPYNAIINAGTHSAFPDIEKIALQPRFGFTWSPYGHTNTVLRGGIGVFSDLYQGVLLDNLVNNAPLTNQFLVAPLKSAPPVAPLASGSVEQLAINSNTSFMNAFASGGTLASIQASNPFFAPPSYFSVANQINNPKYLEWNFEIQQAIDPKTVLTLNYVGTHGYNILVQNGSVNAINATGAQFGQIPTTATDPRFGAVTELASVGRSNYDGLVTTVTRKFTYGFQGSVNYTFSHSLDDLTSTSPNTPYNGAQSVVYQINPNNLRQLNYGNSDSDARHNLTANYVWTLPYKFQNRLMEQAVGGWTVAGTFFYHSPFPYSALTTEGGIVNIPGPVQPILASFNGGSTGNCSSPGTIASPNQCLSASQFLTPGQQTVFGNVPRNSFRGPGYFDTDFSLLKNFSVTERVKFQMGANFFNILNHPNFNAPVNNVTAGNFGQITSTTVQPTTPYGSYQGAGVSGRLTQITAKVIF
jgi:hypothetical protein